MSDVASDAAKPSSGNTGPPRGFPRRMMAVCLLGLLLAGTTLGYYRNQASQVRQLRLACRKAIAVQDWDALEQQALQWQQKTPHDDDARMYLAEALTQKRQYQQALDVLENVSADYHGILEVMAVRAELLFGELRRPFEAAQIWEDVVQARPDAAVPRQRLIYFYAMTLQRHRMVDHIRTAIKLGIESPECYSYLVLSNDLNFSDGLVTVTQWLNSDPDNRVLQIAQAVYAAKTSGANDLPKFGTSSVIPGDQALLEKCLKQHPDSIEALSLTIEQAIFAGDQNRVANLMSQAAETAARDDRFWRYRGWLLQQRGQFAEAEKAFRRSLEIQPFAWRSRLLLADVLRKLQRLEDAEQESALAITGKTISGKILAGANARDLETELAYELLDYAGQTGETVASEGLARRLNEAG